LSNQVHPTAIFENDVQLGRNNVVHAYTILVGPLHIGDDNLIGPQAVIGAPGQDTRNPRYDSSACLIRIGSGNIIREHVAIQKPCYEDVTHIGDNVHVMHGVHVPHDAWIEDDVTLTAGAVLAGSVRVLHAATVAMGCTVHQRSVIGQYSIAAMGAAVMKNIRPFSRHIPGRPTSVNRYALEKYGLLDVEAEITLYVLEGRRPITPSLLAVIEHYEQAHLKSGRQQYGQPPVMTGS